MAYNLYQVQMAKAWTERIDKENKIAEKFWTDHAMNSTTNLHGSHPAPNAPPSPKYAASVAGSAAPTGYSSKTSFLKERLEKLERDLQDERQHRVKVEEELELLKTASRPSSKPGTPRGGSKPGTPRS